MVHNLTLSAISLQRDGLASELFDHSVDSAVLQDGLDPEFNIWAAYDLCLRGEVARARQLLYRTPAELLNVSERPYRDFAELLVAVVEGQREVVALTDAERKVIGQAEGLVFGAAAAPQWARLFYRSLNLLHRRAGNRWRAFRAWLHYGPGSIRRLIDVLLFPFAVLMLILVVVLIVGAVGNS